MTAVCRARHGRGMSACLATPPLFGTRENPSDRLKFNKGSFGNKARPGGILRDRLGRHEFRTIKPILASLPIDFRRFREARRKLGAVSVVIIIGGLERNGSRLILRVHLNEKSNRDPQGRRAHFSRADRMFGNTNGGAAGPGR